MTPMTSHKVIPGCAFVWKGFGRKKSLELLPGLWSGEHLQERVNDLYSIYTIVYRISLRHSFRCLKLGGVVAQRTRCERG